MIRELGIPRPNVFRGLVWSTLLLGALGACEDNPTDASPLPTEFAILSAMEEALQDEYRAEAIYLTVMDGFGEVRPFSNIIYAEVRHSDAIGRLYEARGMAIPASIWGQDDVPTFSALSAACQAGVQAELDNAAIYDQYLGLDLPWDVRRVFESNRAASLNNHLPAFQRCS